MQSIVCEGFGEIANLEPVDDSEPHVVVVCNPAGLVAEEAVSGEASEPLAAGSSDRKVDGGSTAAVWLAKGSDPGTIGCEDLGSIVRAPVIHNDGFEIRVRLGQDGIQRLAKERAPIVHGDDNGYLRRRAPDERFIHERSET